MSITTFVDFSGGLNNLQDKRAIPQHSGQIYSQIDGGKIVLTPKKAHTALGTNLAGSFAYRWKTYNLVSSDYRKYVEFDGELYYLASGVLKKRNSSGVEKAGALPGLFYSNVTITGSTASAIEMSLAVTSYDSITGVESGAASFDYSGYSNVSFDPTFNTTFNSGETLRFYIRIAGTTGSTYGRPNSIWVRYTSTHTIPAGKTLDKIEVAAGGSALQIWYTDASYTLISDNKAVIETPTLADRDIPSGILDFDFYNGYLFLCSANSSTLYWSKPFNPSAWSELNTLNIDGTIVSITATSSGVVIMTQYSIYLLTGNSEDDFALMEISDSLGCAHKGTIAKYKDILVFFANSEDGLIMLSGMSITYLTKNKNNLSFSTSSRYISAMVYNGRYYLVNSPNTTTTNAYPIYEFDFERGILTEMNSNVTTNDPYYSVYRYPDDDTIRLITDTNVYTVENSSTDTTMTYKSPFLVFDVTDKKKFNYVEIYASSTISYTIKVDEVTVATGSVITSTLPKVTKVQLPVTAASIGTGIEVQLSGTGKIISYSVDYDVLETTKIKEFFTHIVIEHTTAVTFSVYDSGDVVKMSSKLLPANLTGKTMIALSTPFFDYYGYVVVSSGTVTNYQLVAGEIQ